MMTDRTDINNEIKKISESVSLLPKTNPYTVPDGYFDLVATETLLKITDKKSSFSVPSGYFEKLTDSVIKNIIPVKNSRKSMTVKMFRFAAAAVVISILGWSVINLLHSNLENTSLTIEQLEAKRIIKENSFEKELEMLSDNEAVSYLAASGHDVKTALVASLTNNNDLPEMKDFLTDQLTLDSYLGTMGLSESKTNKN
jgi:hypothetical protein